MTTQTIPNRVASTVSTLMAALLISCLPPEAFAESVEPPEGFRALFNGKNLAGWYGDDVHQSHGSDDLEAAISKQQKAFHKHWKVENGELINDGKGPFAATFEKFGDIDLALEYKTVAQADSGIYLRGSPQVQIWDTTKAGGKWDIGADRGSGGLYNNPKGSPGQLPLTHADRPFGEWNQMKIRHIGSLVWVWLNGQLVVDGATYHPFFDKTKPIPAKGPILLQTHGGAIAWRNIFVREIAPEAANAWLRRGEAEEDFGRIFNGHDFEGWLGDKTGLEADKGVLHWNSQSILHTEKSYGDFTLRFEFLMPEGGNNGLAIRYPGEGDPAYTGMCELQILHNEAERFENADPRQYHGSAYGMVAAHRGYLRSPGQWNYQEVTVVGSTVRVELNGTVILETDLAEVDSFLGDKPHPGRTREEGAIGFAGHKGSRPFQFRNIAVRELAGD